MNDHDIWRYLEETAKIQPLWWYTRAVIPAAIIAVSGYLLIWAMLARRRDSLSTMLFWLIIASVPVLTILPSLYARLAIGAAMGNLGVERPTVAQDLVFKTTIQIGMYLSQIAWLGVAGGLLIIVVLIVGLIRSGVYYT